MGISRIRLLGLGAVWLNRSLQPFLVYLSVEQDDALRHYCRIDPDGCAHLEFALAGLDEQEAFDQRDPAGSRIALESTTNPVFS